MKIGSGRLSCFGARGRRGVVDAVAIGVLFVSVAAPAAFAQEAVSEPSPPDDAPAHWFDRRDPPPPLPVQPLGALPRSLGGAWVAQGPGPITNGQVEGITNLAVVGAIHTVLADPVDPDVLYVGAVNGGIWLTTNALDPSPVWTPLTDMQASLSIGAMEFDPANSLIIVAGFGAFSSYGMESGALNGLLRTTNGGNTWTVITDPLLQNESISGVAARGATLMAAANGAPTGGAGLFRSTDTGANWVNVMNQGGSMLPPAVVFDLVGDPTNASRFYAALQQTGIYRSGDTGATWAGISSGDATLNTAITSATNNNIEMSVASNGRLYVAVIDNGQPSYIGYTDNPTAGAPTWTMMDPALTPETAPVAVTGATNASPIIITSAANHGLTTGQQVNVMGVMGNTAANGNFTVTVPTMGLTNATNASPIVITSAGHGAATGNIVIIGGVTGNTAANGTWTITVINANTFSLNGSAGNGAYAGGGSWTNASLFTLNGTTGNGAYAGGGTWRRIVGLNPKIKPGAQGMIHFSILADPNTKTQPYVGGDRQDSPFPNSIGANDFTGRLFRGDTTQGATGAVPSPQWDHLTHSNAVGAVPGGGTSDSSAPHADSREMTVDATADLIEVDDGGVYVRTVPQDNTGMWESLNGNIQVTELHDIAYDTNSNIIIGGAQDVGTPQQVTTGGTTWDTVNLAPTYTFRSTGDGGDVAVDVITLAGMSRSIRYSSFNNLGLFRRQTYDANNNPVAGGQVFPALNVVSGAALQTQFVTPIALNAINPQRLVIVGSSAVYESTDQGANLTAIAGPPAPGDIGQNAVVYGGRTGGNPNVNVLWVGIGSNVYLRTAAGGNLNLVGAYPGTATVRDIAVDPDDWTTAYVCDATQVYRTTNMGGMWNNVTGNLSDGSLRSIVFVPGGVDGILVGGRTGVSQMFTDNLGVWGSFGTGLPNALVWDLDYDRTDDMLVAGTLGRGAWAIQGVTSCPWDCDPSFDGKVGVLDLLELLAEWDPFAPFGCVGGLCDFNFDGCVDIQDLLKLLAHYRTGGNLCP